LEPVVIPCPSKSFAYLFIIMKEFFIGLVLLLNIAFAVQKYKGG